MLTKKILQDMPEGFIFAQGELVESNLCNEKVRWIAQKGRGANLDWAIYYHYYYKSIEYITIFGNKMWIPDLIKILVECDDEVLKLYRF